MVQFKMMQLEFSLCHQHPGILQGLPLGLFHLKSLFYFILFLVSSLPPDETFWNRWTLDPEMLDSGPRFTLEPSP